MEQYKKDIKNYVQEMQKKGYPIESIKQQLQTHGHWEEVVEEVVEEVSAKNEHEGKPSESKKDNKNKQQMNYSGFNFTKKQLIMAKERIFIAFYLIAVFFFIFWLSSVNSVPLSKVFLSFTPTLITIILVVVVLETYLQKARYINWVIPILTSVGFYVIAQPKNYYLFRGVDVGNVTVANFILSIFFVIFMESLIAGYETEKKDKKDKKSLIKKTKTHKKSAEILANASHTTTFDDKTKELGEYIQAIEDKCKALNFVIGRVYSNKHGGSADLRDKIKINSEWYNTFSEVNEENIVSNMVLLKKVLWSIYDRLLLIDKKEREVFTKKEYTNLEGLNRDKLGEETVIEVMVNNDKDPVMTYYKSAIDFCKKATEELRKFEKQ